MKRHSGDALYGAFLDALAKRDDPMPRLAKPCRYFVSSISFWGEMWQRANNAAGRKKIYTRKAEIDLIEVPVEDLKALARQATPRSHDSSKWVDQSGFREKLAERGWIDKRAKSYRMNFWTEYDVEHREEEILPVLKQVIVRAVPNRDGLSNVERQGYVGPPHLRLRETGKWRLYASLQHPALRGKDLPLVFMGAINESSARRPNDFPFKEEFKLRSIEDMDELTLAFYQQWTAYREGEPGRELSVYPGHTCFWLPDGGYKRLSRAELIGFFQQRGVHGRANNVF